MKYAMIVGILSFLISVGIPDFLGANVEIIRAEEVGIYEMKVITAPDGSALIAWLNDNGFHYDDGDKAALDQYIRAGWCFVAAQVKPQERDRLKPDWDGLIDPIILRFATPSPIYPLALTSTIGIDTQVLIYLFAGRKMQTDERLPLVFADRSTPFLSEKYFVDWERNLHYLCKFRGAMTPTQMQSDLAFTPAQDQKPYREHLVQW